jgi:hypothetical protein
VIVTGQLRSAPSRSKASSGARPRCWCRTRARACCGPPLRSPSAPRNLSPSRWQPPSSSMQIESVTSRARPPSPSVVLLIADEAERQTGLSEAQLLAAGAAPLIRCFASGRREEALQIALPSSAPWRRGSSHSWNLLWSRRTAPPRADLVSRFKTLVSVVPERKGSSSAPSWYPPWSSWCAAPGPSALIRAPAAAARDLTERGRPTNTRTGKPAYDPRSEITAGRPSSQ